MILGSGTTSSTASGVKGGNETPKAVSTYRQAIPLEIQIWPVVENATQQRKY